MPLVDIKNLTKHFVVSNRQILRRKKIGVIKACDGLSFSIDEAKTMGLVGESGCGKTTTAKVMLYMTPPTDGKFYLDGEDVFETFRIRTRGKKKKLALRRTMQMIFQNPYAALNPRQTVESILDEPLKIHTDLSKEERREHAHRMLKLVNLEDYHLFRYPHEFSGGQRQRICIARALILEPSFLIADEPLSSLDVSIRAQILNLLRKLQKQLKLTYLYISHDLSSIRYISHHVAVMYLGKIVEYAHSDDLFESPLHPYTRALISAVPIADPKSEHTRIILRGDVPSAMNPPSGCPFHPRCHDSTPICEKQQPKIQRISNDHWVACHLY